ncbi:MAG: mechanosensitive ion channel [Deltaproteobacteria bacterium]|nr:MAG: mechanosensitive ion channel [Deltaproteobacteria bacterium]
MKSQVAKGFRFLLLSMSIFLILIGILAAQQPTAPPPSPAAEEPASKHTLADLAPLASELADRLTDLERNIAAGFDITAVTGSLEQMRTDLKAISGRLEKLKASKTYGAAQLAEQRRAINDREDSFTGLTERLTEEISQLVLLRNSWSEEKKRWSEFRSSLPKDVPLSTVKPAFSKAEESIGTALRLINQQLQPMLAAQQEAGDLQTRLHKLAVEVDALLLAVRADVWQKTAPSMLSPGYYAAFDKTLWSELRKGPRVAPWPGWQFFAHNGWVIFLQVLFAAVISIGILRSRKFLEGNKRWEFLAHRPFAAGFLVGVSTLMWLYKPLPAIWDTACVAVISIATARLAGVLFAVAWKRRLIYGLILLNITINVFQILGLPLPLFRLFIFCVSCVGLPLCIWRSMASVRRGDSALYTWTLRLGGIVFILVLAAELGGYSALASRLLESSTSTILILLLAWILMLLARGGLELAANSSQFQKVPFLSSRADTIVRRFALFTNVIIATMFFAFILMSWGLYESHLGAIEGVFSLGFSVGSWRISAGLVLTAAAVLYGSFLASWAVQAALMEGALSRLDIDTGIQFSVAKLVHYGLIFLGFLAALAALGVDLKNITIIGGALGVGIGFGLQTVVNNFVCGLILLFERPIKVGDYIEYTGQWAEVKKIGLRSTIVGTFDRADIVVPNSTLITNDVINWTRSDRLARIRLPIGVAYGSDVPLVMQILLECSEENPGLMRLPAPKVYFLGFGESALNFELRVHLSDIDNWYPVQTELLQEIDRRFRESGVKIPFPQRHLHVQSAAGSPTSTLTPLEDERPGLAVLSSKKSDEEDQ